MGDWSGWIGRETRQSDLLTPAQLQRFRATFDSADAGDLAAQGIHWCLCLPEVHTVKLAEDGHPRRDDSPDSFLPPVPLPRRMWATSTVVFHAPLQVSATIERRSIVADITEKQGTSGHLVFVQVDHETSTNGTLAVSERQTIVYREAANVAAPAPSPQTQFDLQAGGWQWHREILPAEPLLFRYSALTFNSHRIHYDRPYAINEEGYRGLVVHGPLMATLLLDLAARELEPNRLTGFDFRAQSPAFAGEPLHLVGKADGEVIVLAALGEDGRVILSAKGTL
jgi:3-methylfumaryl-CoA hydratase